MTRYVHLHGEIVAAEDARISPFDRGLLLGDGVFETIRAYAGRPHALEAHLARLARSCRAARLPTPEGVAEAIDAVLLANRLDEAALRVTVTRGPGGKGASPRGAGPPTLLVTASPVEGDPAAFDRGVRLVTASRRRVGAESLDPAMKSLNYLANVLARAEAEAVGADDALFLSPYGNVVEATTANVFALLDGVLVTPPLTSGCLPGVTRSLVLDLARREGLAPEERPIPRASLDDAEEAFLTATILEVMPVAALDGRPLGGSCPGPTTRRLADVYRKAARRESKG